MSSDETAVRAFPSRPYQSEPDQFRQLHRSILGMIDLLPSMGEEFPVRQRVVWLRTMAGLFELIYGCPGSADLTIEEAQHGTE